MGQLMTGLEESMKPFEELATKFRNYDSGAEKAPEEVPIFRKSKSKKAEDSKMESPAVLQKEESKKSQSKEEEKKDEAKQPEEVTTLKSLNMDDVHKKT